jgi:DNA-binding transcriptional regulator YhcF (GntR family)
MPLRTAHELHQLLDKLRLAFYRGELRTGDRVPSSRKIATQLRISPTTALALFKLLEDEGVLESRERSGTFLRRVGLEKQRTPNDVALFELVLKTCKRLKLLQGSASRFSSLLERALGEHPRDDFKFGVVMHTELFENTMLNVRPRYPMLQVVRLAPTPDDHPDPREILARDRTIKCLIATYLYSDRALELAHAFNLPMLTITTELSAWQELKPPADGKRYLIARERHTAHDLRQLILRILGADVASRLLVGALEAERDEDAEFFGEVEHEAQEVIAFMPSEAAVKARWAGSKSVITAHLRPTTETLDEMLFHYLFG